MQHGFEWCDKKTDQSITYDVKDGLPDNNVLDIVPDKNGNSRLSADNGICKFTPPSSEYILEVCRNWIKEKDCRRRIL